MAYRRRGSHNGLGAIIRPPRVAPTLIPPRSPPTDDERNDFILQTNSHSHSPPTTNPNSNSGDNVLDMEDANHENDVDNHEEEAEFPDATGNPMANKILHQFDDLWLVV